MPDNGRSISIKHTMMWMNASSSLGGLILVVPQTLVLGPFLFNIYNGIWIQLQLIHIQRSNNKINGIHERPLRVFYYGDISIYDQLLNEGKSFSVYQQNIQRSLTELYKALNDISGNSL